MLSRMPGRFLVQFQDKSMMPYKPDWKEKYSDLLLCIVRTASGFVFKHYHNNPRSVTLVKKTQSIALKVLAAFAAILLLPITFIGLLLCKCSQSHLDAYRAARICFKKRVLMPESLLIYLEELSRTPAFVSQKSAPPLIENFSLDDTEPVPTGSGMKLNDLFTMSTSECKTRYEQMTKKQREQFLQDCKCNREEWKKFKDDVGTALLIQNLFQILSLTKEKNQRRTLCWQLWRAYTLPLKHKGIVEFLYTPRNTVWELYLELQGGSATFDQHGKIIGPMLSKVMEREGMLDAGFITFYDQDVLFEKFLNAFETIDQWKALVKDLKDNFRLSHDEQKLKTVCDLFPDNKKRILDHIKAA